MKPAAVEILDTTLRDGAQSEGVSFSVNDKLRIVETLRSLGVAYIEAGNPGSNPKDRAFFEAFHQTGASLGGTRLAAFGSTRRKGVRPEDDAGLAALLEAGTDTVVVFGKVRPKEIVEILGASPEENLAMLRDTVLYLRSRGRTVIYDAEHFFDGYRTDSSYALACLAAAAESGAVTVCLCDTNGGTMPEDVTSAVKAAIALLSGDYPQVRIGIHTHNDTGLAVANTLAAVLAGASHVQGTLIGIGERCGNANLSTIIPNLQLKYGIPCIPADRVALLTHAARSLAETANLALPGNDPYVGASAFSHKGGMHVDAVTKNPTTYEHVLPDSVGNSRRFLLSEVAGRSSVLSLVRRIRPDVDKNAPEVSALLERFKTLEHEGYSFEGAEASQTLLVCKELQLYKPFFHLEKMRISGEQPRVGEFSASAFIKIHVGDENEVTAGEGDGPVNAMDRALRKALEVFYPQIAEVRLTDYKVRVLDTAATASKVRVLIESTDGNDVWSTVGVSTDILEASWQALVDSLEYKLMKASIRNLEV